MQLTPVQKLAITVGAALLILGLFGAASYYYAARLVAADRIVERANANMAAAFRMVVARQEGERQAKAYVVRPDSTTRAMLQTTQAQVEDALEVMRRGTEDNPRQFQRVRALASGAAQQFDAFRTAVLLRDRAGANAARRFLSSEPSANVADSLMSLVMQIREEELRVLGEQTRLQNVHGTSVLRIILVAMAFTFLLAGVALQPVRVPIATRLTSHIIRAHGSGSEETSDAGHVPASAASQLQALHQLATALSDATGAAEAARAIVRSSAPLDAALVAVVMPGSDGAPTAIASSNAAFNGAVPDLARPVSECLRTGEPALAASRAEREERWGSLDALDACGATGAVLFSPLTRDGAAIGVLVIAHAGVRPFADDDLIFASMLGRFGGPAVDSRTIPS